MNSKTKKLNYSNIKLFLNFSGLFLSVFVFVFISHNAEAKDLFVSTTGSDATSYSINDVDHPWLTVEHAWANALDNDTVYYREGTYTITTSINNLTSGEGVTHTSYTGEQAVWNSSLENPIYVSENYTTVDGINCNWTGAEGVDDDGFFTIGWSTNGVGADYFILKNGTHTKEKYNGNSGIVHGRQNGTDHSTHCTIENNTITGPGSGVGDANTSGISCFEVEDWIIKNNEISGFPNAIYFNKHPSTAATSGGLIQNNYFHDVVYAVKTQTNYTTFDNNIFAGRVSMGYDSGPSASDGNVGSDHNTFTHNTITGFVEMNSATRSGDNELIGTIYPVWTDNIMPVANFDAHRYSPLNQYYEGDHNLWPPAGTIYVYESGTSAKTLTTFRTFLGGCPNADNECNSIEQTPTFVGGASPSSINDFALTSESYGYQSCLDSSDMGADVSLVGVDAGAGPDTIPPSAPSGLSVS